MNPIAVIAGPSSAVTGRAKKETVLACSEAHSLTPCSATGLFLDAELFRRQRTSLIPKSPLSNLCVGVYKLSAMSFPEPGCQVDITGSTWLCPKQKSWSWYKPDGRACLALGFSDGDTPGSAFADKLPTRWIPVREGLALSDVDESRSILVTSPLYCSATVNQGAPGREASPLGWGLVQSPSSSTLVPEIGHTCPDGASAEPMGVRHSNGRSSVPVHCRHT